MPINKTARWLIALVAVLALCFAMVSAAAPAVCAQGNFTVVNPYEAVDWDAWGQHKASLHVHTDRSDGKASLADTVRRHHKKGYDILAVTDHNVLTQDWGALLTAEQKQAAEGMIVIPYTIEQSRTDHINTFWTPFNNEEGATMDGTLERSGQLGGLSILNHPGRYTGGQAGGKAGASASDDPANVAKYVNLFRAHDSAIGMEIINKLDNESRSDRILWDNILMELMPEGRPVWGFSNDDSHSLNAIGYSFNVMLMPELTADAAKLAMESGAFYAVARVARPEKVNAAFLNRVIPSGMFLTWYLLYPKTPVLDSVTVADSSITVTGRDYRRIEWIADGVVIAKGPSLDLNAHADEIQNNYVRAQLVGCAGIAFTQPFGVFA